MGTNSIISQLAIAASRTTSALGDELATAYAEAASIAPEYTKRLDDVSEKVAVILKMVLSGAVPLSSVREAVNLESRVLLFLASPEQPEARKALQHMDRAIFHLTEAVVAFTNMTILAKMERSAS